MIFFYKIIDHNTKKVTSESYEMVGNLLVYYLNLDIKLNIDDFIYKAQTPLSKYIDKSIINMLLDYAVYLKIILNLNDFTDNKNNLLKAIKNNDSETFRKLLSYANEVKLDINNINDNNFFSTAVYYNNFRIVSIIIDYANMKNIILNINKMNYHKQSLLRLSINNNNNEITRLLMNYANDHNILLNINESDGDTLLLTASKNNNTNIVEQLINYANTHDIILNFKNIYNENPVLHAIWNNNVNVKFINRIFEYTSY